MSKVYPMEISQYIENNYLGIGNQELADKINERFGTEITRVQISSYKKNHGFNSGLTGRYEKGNIPVNKGVKGVYAEGSKKTWFKNGHKPVNYREVGSERVNVDGYIEIKVQEHRRWRLKHNVLWEEHNGKIPKNHVVIFLDQNKLNVDISNLKLIHRKELLTMNRYGLYGNNAEITEAGTNLAKLMNVTSRRKKNRKG